jgi:hypothetical protein
MVSLTQNLFFFPFAQSPYYIEDLGAKLPSPEGRASLLKIPKGLLRLPPDGERGWCEAPPPKGEGGEKGKRGRGLNGRPARKKKERPDEAQRPF